MDTKDIIREFIWVDRQEEPVCPYCGKVLEEVGGKWYCENCGVREI